MGNACLGQEPQPQQRVQRPVLQLGWGTLTLDKGKWALNSQASAKPAKKQENSKQIQLQKEQLLCQIKKGLLRLHKIEGM